MSPTMTVNHASSSPVDAKPDGRLVISGTVAQWLAVESELGYDDLDHFVWQSIEDQTVDFPVDADVDVVFSRVSREYLEEVIRKAGLTIEDSTFAGVDAVLSLV